MSLLNKVRRAAQITAETWPKRDGVGRTGREQIAEAFDDFARALGSDMDAEARLRKAIAPFAEVARFASTRPDGPGYLRKEDWARLREAFEEMSVSRQNPSDNPRTAGKAGEHD